MAQQIDYDEENLRDKIKQVFISQGITGTSLDQAVQLSLVTALSRIQNEIYRKKDLIEESQYHEMMSRYSIC